MTSNQIAMLRHLEDERHNYATENEAHRSNVARETETQRSNIMNERLQSLSIAETSRHNKYMEAIGTANALETQTHNRNMEYETNRANVAKEDEIYRHNKESEAQSLYLLEPRKQQIEAETSSTGLNMLINAGKTIGGFVSWLSTK